MKASFSFLALFAVFVLVFGTVVAIEQTTARQPIPSAYADDDEDEEEDDDDDEDDRDDVDDDEDEDDDDADENEDDDDDDIKKPQTNRVAPAAKAVQTRTENRGQQQAAQQQSAVASTVQNIRTDDDAATDDDDADEVMTSAVRASVRRCAKWHSNNMHPKNRWMMLWKLCNSAVRSRRSLSGQTIKILDNCAARWCGRATRLLRWNDCIHRHRPTTIVRLHKNNYACCNKNKNALRRRSLHMKRSSVFSDGQ